MRIDVSIKVGGANAVMSATLNPAVQGVVVLEKEMESRSGDQQDQGGYTTMYVCTLIIRGVWI